MTIVIAQKTTAGVLLAADNDMNSGSILVRRTSPKISTLGPRVAVGLAGMARLNDIVRHDIARTSPDHFGAGDVGLGFPSVAGCDTIDEYERLLARYFRALMKDEPADVSFAALIAVDREIILVGPKGSTTRLASSYHAVGHAADVALGALYVLNRQTMDGNLPSVLEARGAAIYAMEACAEHVEAIRPPWSFAETKAP